MFPPCSLDLEPALKNQAGYVRSSEAWMLSAFVLSVSQFRPAQALIGEFDPEHTLRVSALGPKTSDANAFAKALADTDAAIRRFSNYDVDLLSVVQLEMALPADVDLAGLREARAILGNLPVFWEAGADRAERTIAMIAELNSDFEAPTFGFKLRTGGVTADAFPTSVQISRALVSPATQQVPIKFTAGLHHPIRMYRDEVQTKMHGFLNVLGAAVLAAEHKWDVKQTSAMLDDEDAKSFHFEDQSFGWKEWKIDLKRLKDRRRFVTTFGSCSFDEPREDLRELILL
jgi:hypothetical protein